MSAASLSTLSFSLSFLLLFLFLQRRVVHVCVCGYVRARIAYEAERTGEKRKGNAATHETKGVSRLARRQRRFRFSPTFLSRRSFPFPRFFAIFPFPSDIHSIRNLTIDLIYYAHCATTSSLTDAFSRRESRGEIIIIVQLFFARRVLSHCLRVPTCTSAIIHRRYTRAEHARSTHVYAQRTHNTRRGEAKYAYPYPRRTAGDSVRVQYVLSLPHG